MEQKMAGVSGSKCSAIAEVSFLNNKKKSSTEVQLRRGYLKYLSLRNYIKNTKTHFVSINLRVLPSMQEDQSICDVFLDNISWSKEIFKCTWIYFPNQG